MKTRRTTTAMAALATVALLFSCSDSGGNIENVDGGDKTPILKLLDGKQMEWETQKAGLMVAPDCDGALGAFKQMLSTGMLLRIEEQRKYYIEYYGENGQYKGGWGADASMSMDAGAEAPSQDGGKENDAAGEYSDTNVQVLGVDEADMVKTDGNLMFVMSDKDIVVLDAWPADQMHEISRIALRAYPSGFFRTDEKLVVLSYVNRNDLEPIVEPGEDSTHYDEYNYYRWEPMTLVTTIDITTPEAPVIIDETAFEGSMISSRRIDNKVYLVQQDWGGLWNNKISYWPEEDLWGATDEQINAAFLALAQKNLAFIESLTLEDVLPSAYKLNAQGHLDEATSMLMSSCTALYYPTVYSGTGLLTAVTMDIDDAQTLTGSSVLGDWGTLYASTTALYVAATNWSWWWWFDSDEEQPEIVTHVHKFTIGGSQGAATYKASGTVIGYVLNQFSMDEFEGNLRIATTLPDWGWWDEEDKSESFVTVLRDNGQTLEEIGKVGGLGHGETIQSVRFIGSQGYVVTFRQVDPLYVIDLADPTKPAVSGELKIPGFSSYIHPMGDNHLLTIGRDGNDDGSTFGVSFQIFDVSDPANPTQVAKTTLGEDDGWNSYLWSEAMWDHHAFVYFASRQKLAIPMSGWSWDEEGGSSYDSYLQLFHVDVETGVTPYGTISHVDLIGELPEVSESSYCWYDMSWVLQDRVQIKRGVFMDDFIYSISRSAVKVHDLNDLNAGAITHVVMQTNDDLGDYLQQYYGYCWYEYDEEPYEEEPSEEEPYEDEEFYEADR